MAEIKELTAKDIFDSLEGKEWADLTVPEQNKVMKSILELGGNKTEKEREDLYSDWRLQEILDGMKNSPRKNYRRNQEIAKGIEGGVSALKTLSNMQTARRQIDEAQRLENELIDPSAPPTTPKSEELRDATEMARRDMSQPIREIDPILQRNMDLLNQGFNVAETTSGGQAGVSGAMKQSAINQARTSNQAMIPAIEGIRRQQKEAYNRLVAAGISEDDMRFKQEMQKYRVAENRYLQEAQAIGGLRAAGEANKFGQQQQLWDQVGGIANQAMNYNYGKADPVAATSQPNYPTSHTGVQSNNIAATGATYNAPYTAISNFGNNRYQDYSTRLDESLNNIYNPYLKRQ